MSKSISAMIGALVMTASASTAMAQDGPLELEETSITGRIQKPEAFYVLQHAQLDYAQFEVRESFVEEIKQSVEEDPF